MRSSGRLTRTVALVKSKYKTWIISAVKAGVLWGMVKEQVEELLLYQDKNPGLYTSSLYLYMYTGSHI